MQQLEFILTGEYIELHQLLKLSGLASSGGAGKALVAMEMVYVDDAIETRKTCKIRANQQVRLGNTLIQVKAPDANGTDQSAD
jgi:ribosome-associated protein